MSDIALVNISNNLVSTNDNEEITANDTEKKISRFKGYGLIKKFDINLYNKYDLPARDLLKTKLGDNISDNLDTVYGEDMVITNNKCKYKFIELQVCTGWINEKYPFKYPFIYERKIKFADTTLFIILNKYMTRGLIFDKKKLVSTKPRRLKKYSRYFVYEIPWNRIINFEFDSFDFDLLCEY